MTRSEDELQNLFDSSAPDPRPVDVDKLISVRLPIRQPRKLEMRLTAIALTIAAAVAITLGVFPLLSTSRNLVFAQVLEQIDSITSVTYVQASYIVGERAEVEAEESLTVPKGDPTKDGGARRGRRLLSSAIDALGREENGVPGVEPEDAAYLRTVLQSVAEKSDADGIDDLRWVRIKAKHLQRTDNILPVFGHHDVIDAQANSHVTFDHARKIRRLMGQQVVIDRETNTRTEHEVKFSPKLDFFKRFQSVPDDAVQLKEMRKIDGQQAVAFQTTEQNRGTWRRTYWIGEESKLPVEIVTEYNSDDARVMSSRWVQSHFVYNGMMPDSLFSTSTPAGYTSEESKVYGYR